MRILIIGAVAAGTSAAAKASRNDRSAEIVIYERDKYISYSGCGMPFFMGGLIDDMEELVPRDEEYFKKVYNVDVKTSHEVLSINPEKKELSIRNLLNGEEFTDNYDKLVIATGARAVAPPIPGVDRENAFLLRNINDMVAIMDYIEAKKPAKAAIVGTGFIGFEVCENFRRIGIESVMIERLPQVTPGLDPDMAELVEKYVVASGIPVYTGVNASEVVENGVLLGDGRLIEADIVILATGIRPNSELASAAGIELGAGESIRVDKRLMTNIEDIYSCGDCAEQFHVVSGKPVYRPLGSTANKMGRIVGDNITGGNIEFRGILGTGVFKIFDLAVAQTGLSEREAKELGYDVVTCIDEKVDRPEYLGGREITIKGIADAGTGRLLGAQVVGYGGVDKRIDVFVTALSFGAKAEDLFHLDLAYSPPFSITRDPVMYTGMILESIIEKRRRKG